MWSRIKNPHSFLKKINGSQQWWLGVHSVLKGALGEKFEKQALRYQTGEQWMGEKWGEGREKKRPEAGGIKKKSKGLWCLPAISPKVSALSLFLQLHWGPVRHEGPKETGKLWKQGKNYRLCPAGGPAVLREKTQDHMQPDTLICGLKSRWRGWREGALSWEWSRSTFTQEEQGYTFPLLLEFYFFKPIVLTVLSRPRLLLRGEDQTNTGVSSILLLPLGNYSLNTNYCYFTCPPRWGWAVASIEFWQLEGTEMHLSKTLVQFPRPC